MATAEPTTGTDTAPVPDTTTLKPANKKSSPKQDLSEEKFTGSR